MFMKRLFTISLLLLSALAMSLYAANASQQTDKLNIPLHPVPAGGTHPRCPAQVSILCYYMDGSLTFIYTANLGTLHCDVVRQSDKTVYEATFFAIAEGSDSLFVSDSADDYIITLTSADSTQYMGEYVLYPEDAGYSAVGYAVQFGESVANGYVAYFGGSVMVKDAIVSPSILVPSDIDKMTNINDISNERGYQGVMELAPVEYTFKQDEASPETPSFGLLAEEVQKVFPELVHEDTLGVKQVDYIGLIPLLIQTVQHLSSEVSVLQQTVEKVKANNFDYGTEGLDNNALVDQDACISINGKCEIAYTLSETVKVAMLYIYGISGKLAGSYMLENRGNGTLVVDTSRFGKGSYIYVLIADGHPVASRQMIVKQ